MNCNPDKPVKDRETTMVKVFQLSRRGAHFKEQMMRPRQTNIEDTSQQKAAPIVTM